MALPTCPKCDHLFFEATTITPVKSNFKINAIHCASCGCVVGVLPFHNTSTVIQQLAEKLGVKMEL